MVKVPEALAGGYHVERAVGEIRLLGGYRIIVDIHTLGQALCLCYLFFRDVDTRPFRAVYVHIPRDNARSRAEVEHPLTVNAQSA